LCVQFSCVRDNIFFCACGTFPFVLVCDVFANNHVTHIMHVRVCACIYTCTCHSHTQYTCACARVYIHVHVVLHVSLYVLRFSMYVLRVSVYVRPI